MKTALEELRDRLSEKSHRDHFKYELHILCHSRAGDHLGDCEKVMALTTEQFQRMLQQKDEQLADDQELIIEQIDCIERQSNYIIRLERELSQALEEIARLQSQIQRLAA